MKKFLLAFFSLLAILSLEQSCQKIDTTDLGIGLIPTVDNVKTFDTTLEVIATNAYLPDSSSVGRSQQQALGVMEDPEFGRTSASMFFELLPVASGYPFGKRDSIQGVDSVVLSLAYAGLYGDSNAIENISVYEISHAANFEDSLYRVNSPDFPVSNLLGQKTVNFTSLNDVQSYKLGEDTAFTTEQNVLRIKLDKSLGTRLVQYDTTDAYRNDSSFRSFFKGVAIRADTIGSPRKKALAYFDISDNAKTRLTVYYRVLTNGVPDTGFAEFAYRATQSLKNPLLTASYHANIIRRNTSGTNYANNIADPSPNKQNLYLQTSPGSFVTVNIPGLK